MVPLNKIEEPKYDPSISCPLMLAVLIEEMHQPLQPGSTPISQATTSPDASVDKSNPSNAEPGVT
jgi:hypothetical protein